MTERTATTVIRCPNCGRKNRVPVAASGRPRCANCHRPLPWIVDALDDTFSEIAVKADPPVIARIVTGRVVLDPRTMSDAEAEQVAAAVRAALDRR